MTRPMGLSGEVVSTVAERRGDPQDALPPLYEAIEPDALEALFDHTTETTGSELLVQFSYAGYTVTVREPGDVSIEK